ncbi:armadillo-type protein [Mycena metata]|uniref:Armadillo-type protein n=1 Tax=Mycena metata TaxID=1033252 RepID=A0AAD7ISB4_9AGAR|nr:armadillo-type protein [Mycena metata]
MQRRLNGPTGIGSVNHVTRTALSLLNRLVDLNFDHIAKRIVALVNDPPVDEKNLLVIAHLCTESAILQPNRAVLYARLCRALPDRIQRVRGQLVRKHVVDTLVNGLEEGYQTSPDVTGTLKRRYFGVVRFLGELYKVGMSPEQMIRGYVKQLLGSVELPLDADLEALCILLDTTGRFLDTAKAKSQMDSHFIRISELAATTGIPMRIRFMLQVTHPGSTSLLMSHLSTRTFAIDVRRSGRR